MKQLSINQRNFLTTLISFTHNTWFLETDPSLGNTISEYDLVVRCIGDNKYNSTDTHRLNDISKYFIRLIKDDNSVLSKDDKRECRIHFKEFIK